jgi:tRNA G37 N-methylase TrmD
MSTSRDRLCAMRFEIITIFPGFFAGFFEHGIVRRAQADGLLTIGVHPRPAPHRG